MADQLGGQDAYNIIRQAALERSAPGGNQLDALFQHVGPSVILMDELVAYVRNVQGVTQESIYTFFQAVTESVKRTKNVTLVATLPERQIQAGDAEGLSKAKDIDLAAMHDKLLLSARGKVRLLKPEEYAERDNSENMTAWEGCLGMVWHLSGVEKSGGISGCTAVARAMRDYESAKRLAGILYTYYERRGDAESASRYNNLVTQWQYISQSMGSPEQMEIDATS